MPEGNVTNGTGTTAQTNSSAIVGINAEAQSPTMINAGSIEDYLISVSPQAQGNPKGTPGGIDEALSGKSLDEQIKIINDLNRVVDNTNNNPNFVDAGAVERDLQQQDKGQEQEQEQEQKQEENSLESRIAALEEANVKKAEDYLKSIEEQNPNSWEEISYEERQEHWNEYQQTQQDYENLKQKFADTYKNNLEISGENDILKSTIGSLQSELKDTKSKLAYLESTANIVNDTTETKLLNLRRDAVANPGGAAELNYLNFLQHERQNLTGQDLSQNINDLYFNKVQKQARPEAVDYEVPNMRQNQNPELNNQSTGNNETKNPGSLEDYLI